MQTAKVVELVRFERLSEGNLRVQLAINGVLAPAIDDHRSHMEEFASDDAYFAQMARNSELLIHLYGDARNPFSDAVSRGKQEEGF